ncbi:O-antigen ligase family protein [Stieleria varia]|uniref:O-Antigen ligase n=1 Tax=Stieleria varia TaxID=2528005 RepID=A0A5C6ATW8_9BACT|nr:O-antigen ligase family protein [Stieleria varia]TWU02462.1 O-Antigen ligase [Stieleria varia]
MAKKRKLKPRADRAASVQHEPVSNEASAVSDSPRSLLSLPNVAIALLAGIVVYGWYSPSDSTEVETGAALWFGVLSLALLTLTWGIRGWNGELVDPSNRRSTHWIDGATWALAIWMAVAAWATCPPGNLRAATNEAWLWVSAAAVFTSARYWLADIGIRRAAWSLMISIAVATAILALYQQVISLPQSRADYLADPDGTLRMLGLSAPLGSAERMIFENRLFDGGPTATYALANSMACVVLIGCVLSLGWMVNRWRHNCVLQKSFSVAVFASCFLGLLLSSSRSAFLAFAVGAVAVLLLCRDPSRQESTERTARRSLRRSFALAGVGAGVMSLITVAVLLFGRKEWVEQAPASLAFRLQYWRATLAMAWQHPVFGAGPGGFQSLYQRYRTPGFSEQPADPHNFVFETLASGGFVAVGILIVLSVSIAVAVVKRPPSPRGGRGHESHPPAIAPPYVKTDAFWLGAGLSLSMIWILGALINRMPDGASHMIAVPIAIAVAWALNRRASEMNDATLDILNAVAGLCALIHLSAAGGWTVPGVAMFVWLLAASVTADSQTIAEVGTDDELPPDSRSRMTRAAIGVASGLALLVLMRFISLGPVMDAELAMMKAERVVESSRSDSSESAVLDAIQDAIDADPWAVRAPMWLASQTSWQVIQSDTASNRQQWLAAIRSVRDRAGRDISVYRTLGGQTLHVYQRWGRNEDLELAQQFFEQAIEHSPSDQGLLAQLAAIEAATGNLDRSRELARRAQELADLSGDVVRDLQRQFIFVVQHLGGPAGQEAVRRPASEVLANQLSGMAVK